MPSDEAWVVVVAKPGGEHIAEASLAGGGWATFCPRFRRQLNGVRIAPDGRRVRTRGASSTFVRPLFPAAYLSAPAPRRPPNVASLLDRQDHLGLMRYRAVTSGNGQSIGPAERIPVCAYRQRRGSSRVD
jgi:hypothetical protein